MPSGSTTHPAHTPSGEIAAAAPSLWVGVSRPSQPEPVGVNLNDISEILKEDGSLIWLDLDSPGPAEIQCLRDEFGFHDLALEDVVRQRQRPKVDEYPGHYFVVLYAPLPSSEEQTVQTAEIDLFVGANYLVTVHYGEIPALMDARTRWKKIRGDLKTKVGFLLHVVADSVIDAYFPVVEQIEEQLEEMEEGMYEGRLRLRADHILHHRRSLYTLRKAIYPLREVFNIFLRRDHHVFSDDTFPYFQDAYDHVLRLLDTIDVERDMATGALEAQLSITSNQLNETMRRLTVVAVCVAVMGAIFGAWGMNFDEVPFHSYGEAGFFMVLGGTTLALGVVLYTSHRLGLMRKQ